MTTWGFIFAAIVVPLLLAEFTDWCPRLAERVLRAASLAIPAERRHDMHRQWLGDLDMIPGRLSKLLFAVGIVVRSAAIASAARALAARRASPARRSTIIQVSAELSRSTNAVLLAAVRATVTGIVAGITVIISVLRRLP